MTQSVSFDRAADYYDETRGFPPGIGEQVIDSLCAVLPATAQLCEIGIGTGRIALPLLARGYTILGVDLSRRMMERLRANLPASAPPPNLLQGDAVHLPLAQNVFDAAIAVHVLHLIDGWERAVREIRRVLRPGGVLYLGNNHRSDDDTPHSRLRQRWQEILQKSNLADTRPGVRDFEAIQPGLCATGATVEEWFAAEWTRTRSLDDALQVVRRRVHSSSWGIPDEIYNRRYRILIWQDSNWRVSLGVRN